DPHSVAAARTLKESFSAGSDNWSIEQGDVLNAGFLASLGKFDIVYSWGVLHHTGALWEALKMSASAVKEAGGTLVIALYNDQGRKSLYWKAVKKIYNLLPGMARPFILFPVFCRIWGPSFVRGLLRLEPFKTWNGYKENRGMSPWHDVVDWVGGYPFEVAKPGEVIGFCRQRGFVLERIKMCGKGCGNNEYVFVRDKLPS
ncbi:MAG: methyltransferase domain-containing protein, partial [Endomicrobiales bacterium]